MKQAATTFAACALNPPMDPATQEPIKFFLTFKSANSCAVHLKFDKRISSSILHSAIIDLPRPNKDYTISILS